MVRLLFYLGIVLMLGGIFLRGSINKKYIFGLGLIMFLYSVTGNSEGSMLISMLGFMLFFIGLVQLVVSLKKKDYRRRAQLYVVAGLVIFIIFVNFDDLNENSNLDEAEATDIAQEGGEMEEADTEDVDENEEAENGEQILNIADLGLTGEERQSNVLDAFDKIGADPMDLEKFTHEGTWIGGDVLSTRFKNNRLIVYLNGDDTVNSINIGEFKVYEEGYEPLLIDDFIVSMNDISALQTAAEKSVKENLTNPGSANFSFLSWGYGRANDIFLVSGNLTANNSLGVESDLDFYIEFKKDGSNFTHQYFVLNGERIFGTDSVVEIEKTRLAEADSSSENGHLIELTYNTIGDYGVEITDNQMPIIYYDLPEGRYQVTTSMNYTVLMVVSKDTHRNTDGYVERRTIDRIELTADSKNVVLNITGDEYITLMINSRVTLEEI